MKALNFITRFGNILLGLAILGGSLYLSYNHSLELFERGGYGGHLAHVGVITFEALFFLSTVNAIILKIRREKAPVRIYLGTIVGGSVIMWSNYSSGLAIGWEAMGLGILIPVSGIVSELIISHALASLTSEKVATQETAEKINEVERADTPAGLKELPPIDKESENIAEESPAHVETREDKAEVMAEKVEELPTLANETPRELENVTSKSEDLEDLGEGQEEGSNDSNRSPIEWALILHEEKGEPPSRRQLAEVAGCSEWIARKTLTELKSQIS